MSDNFYGEVTFPQWAMKYVAHKTTGYENNAGHDDAVITFYDPDARNGEIDLADDLANLGIPFDQRSSEYFEIEAEYTWLRFRDGGESEKRTIQESADMVNAHDVLTSLQTKGAEELETWMKSILRDTSPLEPPLQEITEEQYLAWVASQDEAFRRKVYEAEEAEAEAGAELWD